MWLLLLASCIILYIVNKLWSERKVGRLLTQVTLQYNLPQLPPGPPRLPIVGSLPFINTKNGFNDFSMTPSVCRHPLTTVQVLQSSK